MSPLVSVLLPTRNRSRSLLRALASVQRQTLSDIEILILDDGSTDDTAKVLARAAARDSRIRLLREDSGRGLVHALNRLVAESRGEWLARMDDDDLAHPERLAYQLSWVRRHSLDVCGTWYRRVRLFGHSIMRPPVSHEEIRAELLFQPPLLHPSVFLRRALLLRHGGYRAEFPHAEDYELWTRLAPYCRMGNVPEVLMDYTLSPRQVSRTYNAIQVQLARRIRLAYLRALGIPHTPAQAELHAALRDPRPIHSLGQLEQAGDWLCALASHFAPECGRVFARQWLLVAVRAAGLGMEAYRLWASQQLAQLATAKQRAMLRALTTARLTYRSAPYRLLEPFVSL